MAFKLFTKIKTAWQLARPLGNIRGDSIITVLVAGGVLGIGAVAGGSVIKLMRKQSALSNTAGSLLAIESQLLLGLRDSRNFDATTAASLRAGSGAPGFTLNMNKNGRMIPVVRVGTGIDLDTNGDPCTAAPNKPCAIRTMLDIRCQAGTCRAAYQLAVNAQAAGTALPTIGAQTWPPNFPADYSTVISYDFYKRQAAQNTCPPGQLFVTGLNRQSGAVTCVNPSTQRVPANQISKTITYVPSTNSIEFYPTARPLASAVCPAKYRLQSVSPRNLELGSNVGTCVYRYQRTPGWMAPWPGGAQAVSGQACPSQDYRAVGAGACSYTVVARQTGYCPRACPNPDGSTYDCSTEPEPVINPTISYSTSGPSVTCSLNKGYTGECGADYQATVQWSGYCEITVPETQAAAVGG